MFYSAGAARETGVSAGQNGTVCVLTIQGIFKRSILVSPERSHDRVEGWGISQRRELQMEMGQDSSQDGYMMVT